MVGIKKNVGKIIFLRFLLIKEILFQMSLKEIEEEISQGDFIFVPEGALHQPINTGDKVLELIVARNTPIEIVEEKPDLGRKDC